MKIQTFFLVLVLLAAFSSCNNDQTNKELADAEELLLSQYIPESGIESIPGIFELLDSLQIYYISKKEGPGRQALDGDAVSIRFEVYLLDSTLLYSNHSESRPYIFTLGADATGGTLPANMPGFHSGVGMMNEGGAATFIIPSGQGYGSIDYVDRRAPITIAKYTPLRFEVKISDLTREERD